MRTSRRESDAAIDLELGDRIGTVPVLKGSPARDHKPAPFVKWAGGKGRLLTQLHRLLPDGMDSRRHLEPFVGGGALFFSLAPSRATICDVNESLINTYRVVRDQVDELIAVLTRLAKRHGKEHYYLVRTRYNRRRQGPLHRAAAFIYLNRTCFNGLHRVNRKGEFNVPMGRYRNPAIVDASRLRAASAVLRQTDIRVGSYEGLLDYATSGDFVYLDPPYAPVSATANFTSYTEGGFDVTEQERLREVFGRLDQRGCQVMLSNSDVSLIRQLYRDYALARVAAPRAINCRAGSRGLVSELVVRNYT